MKIIRFERIARRGGNAVVRLSIDGNIYSFEISPGVELALIRLLAGGPEVQIDIPCDVIQSRTSNG